MKDNRLKIGEFSRLCRVTVRTLRHYEAIELLTPQIVEDWTGYRYYAIGQFQKMQSIKNLKELGFSLEEIKELWDDDSHSPTTEALEEKIRIVENLHRAGLFSMKGAVSEVAAQLGASEATVYRYLSKLKG